MKQICLAVFLVVATAEFVLAAEPSFPGFDKAMDPETYEKAGLGKLTSAERAVLDKFVRNYVAAKQKDAAAVAATEAVDRAVKERRVQPPDVIESRIVGPYSGVGLRTIFQLANGQAWRPTNSEVFSISPIQNPNVVIYRDLFGYKMFVEGASMVRVKRVQ
ncbi:MAG: hypothetical protein ACREIF_12265 [Chthoniobacterales bacterium]